MVISSTTSIHAHKFKAVCILSIYKGHPSDVCEPTPSVIFLFDVPYFACPLPMPCHLIKFVCLFTPPLPCDQLTLILSLINCMTQ